MELQKVSETSTYHRPYRTIPGHSRRIQAHTRHQDDASGPRGYQMPACTALAPTPNPPHIGHLRPLKYRGAVVIACDKGRPSNIRGGQTVRNHSTCDARGLRCSRFRRRAARQPRLLPSCWLLAAGSGGVGHTTWAFLSRVHECMRSNALIKGLKRRSGGSGGLTSTHDPAVPVPSGPRLGAQLGRHSEGVS